MEKSTFEALLWEEPCLLLTSPWKEATNERQTSTNTSLSIYRISKFKISLFR